MNWLFMIYCYFIFEAKTGLGQLKPKRRRSQGRMSVGRCIFL